MLNLISKALKKIEKKFILTNLMRVEGAHIGSHLKLGDYTQLKMHREIQSLFIGDHVEIRNNFSLIMGEKADLKIENGVFMNSYCSINCLEKISIGENTLFGEGVKLYDHNHKITEEPQFTIEKREFNSASISIGKNCWLGSNVVVLKGVKIGDNSVIGAGCIIFEDVPAGSKIVNQQNLKNIKD